MQKYRSPLSLLLVYCLCVLAMCISWATSGINGVTGDEPHYLVMANGLARHGALEQTIVYKDAFSQPAKFGIASENATPAQGNMHTVPGPRGTFNVHNLGLPLLLALPFVLGGIAGAKLFMMFCGALVVLLCWRISALFSSNTQHRWLAVFATCIGMPLIPAASQIYPDVLAGLFAVLGLYWFCTTQEKRSATTELLLAATVAYLPWLQIKFGPACAAIVLAVAAKIYSESKDAKRIIRILAVASVSLVILIAYNIYAFGKPSGPYMADAVDFSPTSLMVFLGLHIDQNQGFILQNPINLIGLLGIGWMYRAKRSLMLLWAIVFLSLIVPNALHPNWYGGYSFSGRFGWAAAVVFMVPTIYGLLEWAKRHAQVFRVLVLLSALLQLYLFTCYAFIGTNMYNRDAITPFADYSLFYSGIHDWLPSLYSANWAYAYAPNYAWLALAALLLASGFFRRIQVRRVAIGALALSACSAAVVAASSTHVQPRKDEVFLAANLPSQAGRIDGSARFAEPGVDAAGYISFGPYVPFPRAHYRVTVKYSSAGPRTEGVTRFDIFDGATKQALLVQELPGTEGEVREYSADFEVSYLRNQPLLEFRNLWKGNRQFTLYEISVKAI